MAFGRNVIAPLLFDFLKIRPQLRIDLNCEDRYVDIVAHGLDMAIRLGKLADSTLGCRYVGSNPWVMAASSEYLDAHGEPQRPEDLASHRCLVYSTVQGDEVWRLLDPSGRESVVTVSGPLKSNNLSILLNAARAGTGIAILPMYLASDPLRSGELQSPAPGASSAEAGDQRRLSFAPLPSGQGRGADELPAGAVPRRLVDDALGDGAGQSIPDGNDWY